MQIRYPIKTNFEDLDRFIGGLYPGEIMVFGSYPRVDRLSFLVTLIKKITLESGRISCFNKIKPNSLKKRRSQKEAAREEKIWVGGVGGITQLIR